MRYTHFEDDIKPISEFRSNAAALLKHAHRSKRPLVITQKGKSAAVLLDVGAYDALIERLELLEDIQIAEEQIREKKTISHAQIKKQLRARFKTA